MKRLPLASVLILENEELIVLDVEHYLRQTGYDIAASFPSSTEALSWLKTNRADVEAAFWDVSGCLLWTDILGQRFYINRPERNELLHVAWGRENFRRLGREQPARMWLVTDKIAGWMRLNGARFRSAVMRSSGSPLFGWP